MLLLSWLLRFAVILSQAALTEMRFPGILCVGMPVTTGLIFRWVGSLKEEPMLGAEVSSNSRSGATDSDSKSSPKTKCGTANCNCRTLS